MHAAGLCQVQNEQTLNGAEDVTRSMTIMVGLSALLCQTKPFLMHYWGVKETQLR